MAVDSLLVDSNGSDPRRVERHPDGCYTDVVGSTLDCSRAFGKRREFLRSFAAVGIANWNDDERRRQECRISPIHR